MAYYSVLSIFSLIIIILIFYLLRKNKTKQMNYRALFIIGIIWFAIGLPLKNQPLIITGIAFIIIGFLNKNKWIKKQDK
jgi:membrane-bound ClpP family serine protease